MNTTEILHATCVSYGQSGLLITGKSGSGKSSLALALMAFGAELVADDRVQFQSRDDALIATCPAAIKGMIEARGVGLLAVKPRDMAIVRLVVDLDQIEAERLPPYRTITMLGIEVDVVFGKDDPNLAPALHQLMQIGRRA